MDVSVLERLPIQNFHDVLRFFYELNFSLFVNFDVRVLSHLALLNFDFHSDFEVP